MQINTRNTGCHTRGPSLTVSRDSLSKRSWDLHKTDLYMSRRRKSALFSAYTLWGKTLTAKYRIRISPLKYSNLPFTMMLNVLNSRESKYAWTFSSLSFSLNSLNSSAFIPIQKGELIVSTYPSMLYRALGQSWHKSIQWSQKFWLWSYKLEGRSKTACHNVHTWIQLSPQSLYGGNSQTCMLDKISCRHFLCERRSHWGRRSDISQYRFHPWGSHLFHKSDSNYYFVGLFHHFVPHSSSIHCIDFSASCQMDYYHLPHLCCFLKSGFLFLTMDLITRWPSSYCTITWAACIVHDSCSQIE